MENNPNGQKSKKRTALDKLLEESKAFTNGLGSAIEGSHFTRSGSRRTRSAAKGIAATPPPPVKKQRISSSTSAGGKGKDRGRPKKKVEAKKSPGRPKKKTEETDSQNENEDSAAEGSEEQPELDNEEDNDEVETQEIGSEEFDVDAALSEVKSGPGNCSNENSDAEEPNANVIESDNESEYAWL